MPPQDESSAHMRQQSRAQRTPLGGSVLLPKGGRAPAPAPSRRRVPAHDVVAAGLAVLYVTAVAVTYGRRSVLVDESYSDAMSRLPWSGLLQVLMQRELNGSLHTVLLKALGLGGSSELALRAPSLAAVGLAAWLFYRLLLPYGVTLALVGEVLLLSLWPVAEAAATARSYGLLLLCVVALQLMVQQGALTRPATAVAYGVLAGASLYLHFLAGLVVLAQVVAQLAAARSDVRPPRWLFAALPFAALATPICFFVLLGLNGEQTSWIAPLNAGGVLYAGLDLVALGGPLPLRVLRAALLLIALLVAVRLLLRQPQRRPELVVLAPVLLLPPTLVVLVSVVKPLLVPRYLWMVLPAMVALLVAGLSVARGRRQSATVIVPVAVATLLGLMTTPDPQGDYRAAAAAVERTATAGDVVLPLNAFRRSAVAYYAPPGSSAIWPTTPAKAATLITGSGYEDLRCLPAGASGARSVYVIGQMTRMHALRIARCSGRVLDEASFDDTVLPYGYAMLARFDRPL